jgi:hypothetical protein
MNYIYTVKPVLRGHLWVKDEVALEDRLLLKRGSIMYYSLNAEKNLHYMESDLLYTGAF